MPAVTMVSGGRTPNRHRTGRPGDDCWPCAAAPRPIADESCDYAGDAAGPHRRLPHLPLSLSAISDATCSSARYPTAGRSLGGQRSNLRNGFSARGASAPAKLAGRCERRPMGQPRAAQDLAYRDTVLPPGIWARVSVEAGASSGWKKIIGDAAAALASNTTARPLTARPWAASSASLPPRFAAAARDSIHDARNAPGQEPPRHLAPAAGGTVDRPA